MFPWGKKETEGWQGKKGTKRNAGRKGEKRPVSAKRKTNLEVEKHRTEESVYSGQKKNSGDYTRPFAKAPEGRLPSPFAQGATEKRRKSYPSEFQGGKDRRRGGVSAKGKIQRKRKKKRKNEKSAIYAYAEGKKKGEDPGFVAVEGKEKKKEGARKKRPSIIDVWGAVVRTEERKKKKEYTTRKWVK